MLYYKSRRKCLPVGSLSAFMVSFLVDVLVYCPQLHATSALKAIQLVFSGNFILSRVSSYVWSTHHLVIKTTYTRSISHSTIESHVARMEPCVIRGCTCF